MKSPFACLLASAFALSVSAAPISPDELLEKTSHWEVVAEGFGFTDGLCTDGEGNLYFSDVKGGTAIFKIDLAGNVREFIPDAAGVSGLQWGADGQLYACVARGRRVVKFDAEGHMKELATEVRPNDLVVTHSGNLYFTMTPTAEIRRIDSDGNMTVVDTGTVTKPNGITLSPDQKTLVVSDHGGTHAFAFPIKDDGTLGKGGALIDLAMEAGETVAKGDGAGTDIGGRYYVTTESGLQIFASDGTAIATLPKPDPEQGLVSTAFAGPGHAFLYVANGGKIYRRETKTTGALFFSKPTK